MARAGVCRCVLLLVGCAGILLGVLTPLVEAQRPVERLPPPRPVTPPKQEPVAETKLLMEGLNQANFRGMEKLLREGPADKEAWTFVRGQALLIAETGNLLMLRPPRTTGQDAWAERSAELREAATSLARAAANRDLNRSRELFRELATSCNRCHQTFRVPVKITPFEGTERRVSVESP